MTDRANPDLTKYETAVAEIKKFFKEEGFCLRNITILYGERAAEYRQLFDADYDAILIIYSAEYWVDFYEYAAHDLNPFGSLTREDKPLMEKLIDHLRTKHTEFYGYDYLDSESSILLYFEQNPYGHNGLSRSHEKLVDLQPDTAETLKKHLEEAKRLAENAICEIDDGGACNFDYVSLNLANYPEDSIKSICDAIKLNCRKEGNHLFPTFCIDGRTYGQGMKNSVFCATFAAALKNSGYDVEVICKVD